MKKIVFIFIAVLLSLSMSTQNFSHYTLSEVVDTAQYLNQNFVNQKSYFIGKPFSEVLKVYQLDLPLKFLSPNNTSPWNDKWGDMYINGAALSWYTEAECKEIFYKHINAICYIDVDFEPPYNIHFFNFMKIYKTPEEMALHLKDILVKDIRVIEKTSK